MPEKPFISEEVRDGVHLLKLAANLTYSTFRELKERLEDLQQQNECNTVLDMADCSYADSAGLGVIASFVSNYRQRGGDIRLLSVAPGLKETLTITRLITFFKIYSDADDAVSSFLLDPPKPPVY